MFVSSKHFHILFVFLILTQSIWTQSSSSIPSRIRVGILTKYSPKEIKLRYWNAKVFAGNHSLEKNQTDLNLKSKSNRIEVRQGSKFFTEEFIGLIGGKYEILLPEETEPFRYYGDLEISSINGKLSLVLSITKEEYTRTATESEFGMLFNTRPPREISDHWKNEFRSAAAAVVLSYAIANKNRHKSEGYDLCDLTHCLQYSGRIKSDIKDRSNSFSNYILKDGNGKILEAFFHSSCGGNLSQPSVLWKNYKNEENAFRSGKDRWKGDQILCESAPHSHWETVLSRSELEEIFGLKKLMRLEPVLVQSRVSEIILETEEGKSAVPTSLFLSKIGKKTGWNRLKSNDFTIENSHNGFLIKGKGFGHGIGLCQYGAREMAFQGAKSSDILRFYFPNARLEKL